ncbi:MAG TPA: lamin tail domain-containing protein, partial [Verrucomicrobiae bacterium]|nr:lamin tail domain-containing protein [Verrucomicrobiae bacterium]
MENWMRVFAANHAAGNWDSFGCNNAQNLYGYMGTQGTKYSLMMWDFNIVIGNSGSWGPGQNLFSVNGADPNTQNIYNEPTFRRMYWRALQELVNGPLNTANSGPLISAKYNAFAANGLSVENPSTSIYGWLTSARTSIASQLAVENTTNFIVNPSVTIGNNTAVITGTAPVNVKTLWVNGVEYPLTWTTLTNYQIVVPLQSGTNLLNVQGMDIHGQPITGDLGTVTATYSGTASSAVGHVVINEIMSNPALPHAEFVEIFNSSTQFTYDLSGDVLKGLSYTFPAGSLLLPNSYLVLAADRLSFAAAYGATSPVFDVFPGTLQPDGETLTLVEPGTNGGNDVVISKVRYAGRPPWPASNPDDAGSSLQLIDAQQDNWRAGNWGIAQTNSYTPQWQYVTLTGIATRPIFLIGMSTAGDVYVDDVKLVAGSVPEVGQNYLTNGDFEQPLDSAWTVSPNMSGSSISTALSHSGSGSLHVVASSGGPTIGQAIWQNTLPIVTNGIYTLSYWYLPSTNGTSLLIRISGSSPNSGTIYSLQNYQPPTGFSSLATPGRPNSISGSMSAFPPLWINEVQAENLTGITNGAGQRTAWVELYNPTTNSVSLNGLYLSTNYADLTAWAFPSQATIGPNEFKVVFVDGQTTLATSNELHTSFTVSAGSGSVALSRLYNGTPQVLDYVDYAGLPPNTSYGSVPDGQSFDRQEFGSATPGGSNLLASAASWIPYTSPGTVYRQEFDSLPNPGNTSVNADNPVVVNGVTFSLGNPFDFAASAASGGDGGLGLPELAGW